VINTAAETHVGNSIANSDDFVSSNINGVHNLLELIKTIGEKTHLNPYSSTLAQMKFMEILKKEPILKQTYYTLATPTQLLKQQQTN
jgi:dTDP-D-glucose 4,6-dehydratase